MKPPKKAKAIERLQKALTGISELQNQPHDSPAFNKWHRDTMTAIIHTFGEESVNCNYFVNVSHELKTHAEHVPLYQSVLQSMIQEVQEYWEEETIPGSPAVRNIKANTRDVFIIHGHDHGAKETVARFVTKLELNPIILHELPNQGRTIIQKFEDNAEVAYAIALLTPDDICAAKSELKKRHDRPRQNVIFEFGYFIGRLGGKYVCGLTKGNVEIPSDYSGVVYISLDEAGAWRTELIRELKAAGIDVDANLAI
jgi:predicted nucleotide-binding protein